MVDDTHTSTSVELENSFVVLCGFYLKFVPIYLHDTI